MNEQQIRHDRTAGFPLIPLKQVVEVIQAMGKYGTTHSRMAIASQLGHSTDVSGPFKQKLAAFRDFKLLSTRDKDRVSMTDLAKSLAFPTSAKAHEQDIREAFRSCRIFSDAYDRLAKGITLDSAVLGNIAVRDLGVTPGNRVQFSKAFVESAEFAGLAEGLGEGKFRLLVPDLPAEPRDPSEEMSSSTTELVPKRVQEPQRLKGSDLVIAQAWPVPGGEVRLEIRLDRAMPYASFEALGQVIRNLEGLSDVLKSTATPARESENASG